MAEHLPRLQEGIPHSVGEPTTYQICAIHKSVESSCVIGTWCHSGERRFTDKELNTPDGFFLSQEELYKDMLNPRHLEECVRILRKLKEMKGAKYVMGLCKECFIDTFVKKFNDIKEENIKVSEETYICEKCGEEKPTVDYVLLGVDLSNKPDDTFYRDLILEQHEQG